MRVAGCRTRQAPTRISLKVESGLLRSLEPTGPPGPAFDLWPVPDKRPSSLGHRSREGVILLAVPVDVLRVVEAEAIGDVSCADKLVNVKPPPHDGGR
jgi:hypothetical protein